MRGGRKERREIRRNRQRKRRVRRVRREMNLKMKLALVQVHYPPGLSPVNATTLQSCEKSYLSTK